MQDRPEETVFDNPLRHLTDAQFMALGGNAVVYVRSIKGRKLSEFMEEVDESDAEEEFQLVDPFSREPNYKQSAVRIEATAHLDRRSRSRGELHA